MGDNVPKDVRNKYAELTTEARKAADVYYNTPEAVVMTDLEFDLLVERISELEVAYPALKDHTSPTVAVGAQVVEGDFHHDPPMLSLRKVKSQEDVDAFTTSLRGFVSVEPKCDGTSISLTYVDGKLTSIATRGDGVVGKDVSRHIGYLAGAPLELRTKESLIVRGEAVITKDDFKKINTNGQFKSARNLAAGTINGNAPTQLRERKVCFIAFDAIGDFETSQEIYVSLVRQGFTVAQPVFFTRDPSEAWAFVEKIMRNRDAIPYEIDGAVVKMASISGRHTLGNRSNSPRWAVAFKPENTFTHTKLLDVQWSVGKTGTIAPVAIVSPVVHEGVEISRTTLHNLSEIKRLDLKIGDTVMITRMNSVIPGIIGPVVSERTGAEVDITYPEECPGCGGLYEMFGNSQQIRCVSEECASKTVRKLIHWAGRSAADIDTIGETWIESLYDASLLKTPADFYRLTKEDLLSFDNMGARRADKFLESIDRSRALGLRRTLIGLAIPSVGEGTAKDLCKVFTSLQEVQSASIDDLLQVPGLGMMTALSIREFFEASQELLADLQEVSIVTSRLEEDAPIVLSKNAHFAGKTVVITGSLSVERSEFKRLLEAHGAKVTGSVSGKTDILVVGENVGARKIEGAKKHGVMVIDEITAREAMNL